MAIYVGELARITVTGKSFTAISVSPDDIDAVYMTIYDSTGTEFINEREMTWQPDEELWYWLWVSTVDEVDGSTAIDPGSYRVKIRLLDLDGHSSVEYLRVRLARNPV